MENGRRDCGQRKFLRGDETVETKEAKLREKNAMGRGNAKNKGPEARKLLTGSVWVAKSFGQNETSDLCPADSG